MEKKGMRETGEDECLRDNIHYPEIDCPPKTFSLPHVAPSPPSLLCSIIICSIQRRTELKSIDIGIVLGRVRVYTLFKSNALK